MKVVPKVRVFWWRVLRGILPDSVTLKRHHIKEIGRCDVWHAMDEDMMHALIKCNHAKAFWRAAKERFSIKLPNLHPDTWSRDIILDKFFDDSDRCKIICIMHAIWNSRNCWTHDKEGYNPTHALRGIHGTLSLLELPLDNRKVLARQCWRTPYQGWIKINVDGALDLDGRQGVLAGLPVLILLSLLRGASLWKGLRTRLVLNCWHSEKARSLHNSKVTHMWYWRWII